MFIGELTPSPIGSSFGRLSFIYHEYHRLAITPPYVKIVGETPAVSNTLPAKELP